MKKGYYIAVFLFFTGIKIASAQETQAVLTHNSGAITYAPVPADASTFKVLENTNHEAISTELLSEMNLHRLYDQETIWQVHEGLSILLYPFGAQKSAVTITNLK